MYPCPPHTPLLISERTIHLSFSLHGHCICSPIISNSHHSSFISSLYYHTLHPPSPPPPLLLQMNVIIFHYWFLHLSTISFIFCRGATFTLVNKCDHTIWPGILANAGSSVLDSTGFELPQGGSRSFQSPPKWSGRFWGRTGCNFDSNGGQEGNCVTGDCGSNQVECDGAGANPPATLAEFTIGSGTPDYYDVSLVDGYNLPMVVDADGGSGSCGSTGCVSDLNRECPGELRFGDGVGCKSACEAFGKPEYCCSGTYGSPATCKPSVYSEMFKSACPKSYSFAYDDATSTFTCTGADYTITFCPSTSSEKSARDTSQTTSSNGSASGATTGEVPIVVDNPGQWLPDFFIAHSAKTLTCSPPMVASMILVLILYLHF